MTREEAIKELKNIKENIFWGDEYGVCFRDEWVEAYEMAISALREQTKLATNLQPEASFSCKWISVEERLPEDLPENNGRKVIPCIVALQSCYPNGKATIQKRQRQVTYDYDYNPNGWEWSRIGKSRVTHWMPLPEPPKED